MFRGFMGISLASADFSGLDEDGFPVCRPDGDGIDAENPAVPLHHTFGFFSIPEDPEVDSDGEQKPGSACMLFRAIEGDNEHCWLSYDPRFITTIPQVKKGGSMQYCSWGSFSIFDGDDGTYSIYVPVDKPVTKAHGVTIGVDGAGEPLLELLHSDGMSLVMFRKKAVLKNAAGDAYIELDESSTVRINGNLTLNGGAVLGDTSAALPAAIATHLQSYLTAVEVLLSTLATTLDAKQPPSATSVAAVTNFIAANASLKTQIAALNTKIA